VGIVSPVYVSPTFRPNSSQAPKLISRFIAGADACCTNGKISGYYTPGTFQQYALAPATYVTPIPDALASDLAAPLLCGGVTVYSALKKSRAQPGEWVVIPGSGGGLGHLALQIGSRGMGYRMIGIDVGEKEKLSKECGAEVKKIPP
jgi:alcohol dehydrogenase, propanol-preferring